jgi:hypothetical protein
MVEERIVQERGVETPTTHTTVIERSGGSGAGLIIGIALLLAVLIGGYLMFVRTGSDVAKNNAITSAAKSVGSTADKAGAAIDGGK